MYNINHNKAANVLEIKNDKTKLYSKIHLNQGASLQELTLNGHEIIKDLAPLSYADTYASSILFPFANRIKDGKYTFNNQSFQFETNQKEENNALHGLVYNKTFEVIKTVSNENTSSILLEYTENNVSKGFPYTYKIQLEYLFSETNLALKVTINNTDSKVFPFTLGWHPYFLSANLAESTLQFNSNEKIVLGERNITTGIEPTHTTEDLKIENKQLDDCWVLNTDEVIFKTPKYNLKFNATGNTNFLQVYTPPKQNTIAIEPTTGVSDSFNNDIGLQTLKPNEAYSITWKLSIKNN
ncbi:aldose 1-epimerase [Seonamhaeicola algicola]|uniref:Aldose 1-epimerase n=1 Tax=Seonamhaeicola algicola TaxID=1719036 RepID=A0A5C7B2C9_9FLAO|nr:aldose 1-epimerase [Seonamhaeicola algicola]TXE15048.1 aldose 1-epimerase [Seonamhaeicola algicola]